ncbi:MAG: undecaprenyl-diphosphate phosphatase [Rhodothermales bacterium]|nr:undecaprenyl-diphosphate phosphatase [Rhodothermales bacterium]
MELWEAIVLGLVQGLTEFLPVSSSGHLVLGEYLLGIDKEAAGNVTFEVFVHFGTVLSILTVYWRSVGDIIGQSFGALVRPSEWRSRYVEIDGFRMGVNILITMIPTGITYILFKDFLEARFSDPRFVAGMLIVTGVLLLLTLLRKKPSGEVSPVKAFFIGVAQAFAMLPGISRSGSTICTALYLNTSPEKAANFSFLMLLPVVTIATAIKSIEMFQVGFSVSLMALLLGALTAYVSGVVAIKLLLDIIRRGKIQYFAIYCFIVGGFGLWLLP